MIAQSFRVTEVVIFINMLFDWQTDINYFMSRWCEYKIPFAILTLPITHRYVPISLISYQLRPNNGKSNNSNIYIYSGKILKIFSQKKIFKFLFLSFYLKEFRLHYICGILYIYIYIYIEIERERECGTDLYHKSRVVLFQLSELIFNILDEQ